MGSDTIVALGRATVDGCTLLGQNCSSRFDGPMRLCLTPARKHAVGERAKAQFLELTQPRQTYRVFGVQPPGAWGYVHGMNEHQLAVTSVPLQEGSNLHGHSLPGTDLVRLLLERCTTALQAVDLLGEFLTHHSPAIGSGFLDHLSRESNFVVADGAEAYVIETAGPFWVYQEIKEVRAVSDLRIIRQDWDRIAHGLADHAYARGWWPQDGSKLDFAGALGESPLLHPEALHRWGRATLYLQEQNGHIDGSFVRKILCDHESDSPLSSAPFPSICRHATKENQHGTAVSFVTALREERAAVPMAWCCMGLPCSGVYLPIFLDGDIPTPSQSRTCQALADPSGEDAILSDRLQHLQAEVDQSVEEFLPEALLLKRNGSNQELHRQATSLMQYYHERLEAILEELSRSRTPEASPSERCTSSVSGTVGSVS